MELAHCSIHPKIRGRITVRMMFFNSRIWAELSKKNCTFLGAICCLMFQADTIYGKEPTEKLESISQSLERYAFNATTYDKGEATKPKKDGTDAGSGGGFYLFPPPAPPRGGGGFSQAYELDITFVNRPNEEFLYPVGENEFAVIPDEDEASTEVINIRRTDISGHVSERNRSMSVIRESAGDEEQKWSLTEFWNYWLQVNYLKIWVSCVSPRILISWAIKRWLSRSKKMAKDVAEPTDSNEKNDEAGNSVAEGGREVGSSEPREMNFSKKANNVNRRSNQHRGDDRDREGNGGRENKKNPEVQVDLDNGFEDLINQLKSLGFDLTMDACVYDFINRDRDDAELDVTQIVFESDMVGENTISFYRGGEFKNKIKMSGGEFVKIKMMQLRNNSTKKLEFFVKKEEGFYRLNHNRFSEDRGLKSIIDIWINFYTNENTRSESQENLRGFNFLEEARFLESIDNYIALGLVSTSSESCFKISKNLSELIEWFWEKYSGNILINQYDEHLLKIQSIESLERERFLSYLKSQRKSIKVSDIEIKKEWLHFLRFPLLAMEEYIKHSYRVFYGILSSTVNDEAFLNNVAVYGGLAVKTYIFQRSPKSISLKYPFTVNDVDLMVTNRLTSESLIKSLEDKLSVNFPELAVLMHPLPILENGISTTKVHLITPLVEGASVPPTKLFTIDVSFSFNDGVFDFKDLGSMALDSALILNNGDAVEIPFVSYKVLTDKLHSELKLKTTDAQKRHNKALWVLGKFKEIDRESSEEKETKRDLVANSTVEGHDENPNLLDKLDRKKEHQALQRNISPKIDLGEDVPVVRKKTTNIKDIKNQRRDRDKNKKREKAATYNLKARELFDEKTNSRKFNVVAGKNRSDNTSGDEVSGLTKNHELHNENHSNSDHDKDLRVTSHSHEKYNRGAVNNRKSLNKEVVKNKEPSKKELLTAWKKYLDIVSAGYDLSSLDSYSFFIPPSIQGKYWLLEFFKIVGIDPYNPPPVISLALLSAEALDALKKSADFHNTVAMYFMGILNSRKNEMGEIKADYQLIYAAKYIKQANDKFLQLYLMSTSSSYDFEIVANFYSRVNDMPLMILPFSIEDDTPVQKGQTFDLDINLQKLASASSLEALKEVKNKLYQEVNTDFFEHVKEVDLHRLLIARATASDNEFLFMVVKKFNELYILSKQDASGLNSESKELHLSRANKFKNAVVDSLDLLALSGFEDLKMVTDIIRHPNLLTFGEKRKWLNLVADRNGHLSDKFKVFSRLFGDVSTYRTWMFEEEGLKISSLVDIGVLDEWLSVKKADELLIENEGGELVLLSILKDLGLYSFFKNGVAYITLDKERVKLNSEIYFKELVDLLISNNNKLLELYRDGMKDPSSLLSLIMFLSHYPVPFEFVIFLSDAALQSKDSMMLATEYLLDPESFFFDPIALLSIFEKFKNLEKLESRNNSNRRYYFNLRELQYLEDAFNLTIKYVHPKESISKKKEKILKKWKTINKKTAILVKVLGISDEFTDRVKKNIESTISNNEKYLELVLSLNLKEGRSKEIAHGRNIFADMMDGNIDSPEQVFLDRNRRGREKYMVFFMGDALQGEGSKLFETLDRDSDNIDRREGIIFMKYYMIHLYNNLDELEKILIKIAENFNKKNLAEASYNSLAYITHSGGFLFNEELVYSSFFLILKDKSPQLAIYVLDMLARWNSKYQEELAIYKKSVLDENVRAQKDERSGIMGFLTEIQVAFESSVDEKSESLKEIDVTPQLKKIDHLRIKLMPFSERYRHLYPVAFESEEGWRSLLESVDFEGVKWNELSTIFNIFVFCLKRKMPPKEDEWSRIFFDALNLSDNSIEVLLNLNLSESVLNLVLKIKVLEIINTYIGEAQNKMESRLDRGKDILSELSAIHKIIQDDFVLDLIFVLDLVKEPSLPTSEGDDILVTDYDEKSFLLSIRFALAGSSEQENIVGQLVKFQEGKLSKDLPYVSGDEYFQNFPSTLGLSLGRFSFLYIDPLLAEKLKYELSRLVINGHDGEKVIVSFNKIYNAYLNITQPDSSRK